MTRGTWLAAGDPPPVELGPTNGWMSPGYPRV
jgi:hypothetical protein